MEKIGTSKPVNKTAALVVSKGYQFEPGKRVLTLDSDTPLPVQRITKEMRRCSSFSDMTGHKFGRFTVIGLSQHKKGSWVVRCQCGKYTTRRKKAILNPENVQDRCEHCRYLAYLKKDEEWRRTGIDKNIRDF